MLSASPAQSGPAATTRAATAATAATTATTATTTITRLASGRQQPGAPGLLFCDVIAV